MQHIIAAIDVLIAVLLKIYVFWRLTFPTTAEYSTNVLKDVLPPKYL
jgi:hypothetical protein